MRRENSILLLAQAHHAEHITATHEEMYLAGYLQAIEDAKTKEKKKVKEIAKVSPPGVPSFDDFWKAYKKSADKYMAQKRWANLSDEDKKLIMLHVPGYVASTPDKKYRKNAATYLYNKCWLSPNDNNGTEQTNSNDRFFENRSGLIAQLNAARGTHQK